MSATDVRTKTVAGFFNDMSYADTVVQDLERAGINRDQISVIAGDGAGKYQEYASGRGEVGGEAASGAGAGAAIGGGLGMIAGLAALAIPGFGPIVAAGPIAAALTGAGVGAAAGGIIGGLTHMGISHDDAASYAEGIRRGGVLVTVRTGDSDVAERAANIMDDHGAEDIDKHVAEWKMGGWMGAPGSGMESRPERMEERAAPQAMETRQGAVRVFTQETETPVGETVTMRERANVENRPVDRPESEAEFAAFSEGTIEFPDVSSEPVRDSMRRTHVDVERMEESKSGLEYETDFRRHHESRYGNSGSPYEQYAPAYNYGSTLANDPRYHQREWEDVETDVKRDWETRGHGAWNDFKDAIHHGWDRVRGRGASGDADFRRHHESHYGDSGSAYEQYAPAYHYGSTVANDSRYNQREWGDVETDAKQDWETREHGAWEDFKDAIRHGWDKVRGRR